MITFDIISIILFIASVIGIFIVLLAYHKKIWRIIGWVTIILGIIGLFIVLFLKNSR